MKLEFSPVASQSTGLVPSDTQPGQSPVAQLGKRLSLRELITDEIAAQALKVQVEIINNDEAPMSIRARASEYLLDQAFGKARQFMEVEQKVLTYADVLDSVRAKEEKYQAVVDAQEVKQVDEPSWDDLR